MFFIWQDQTVVRGMTTVHDGKGYMIRPRRRPKDSSSMMASTRSIFDIPCPDTQFERNFKKDHSSKLALPVTRPIDDYNYNMNGVNMADQFREDLTIGQATVRAWLVYWFWLLDYIIINSYILWKGEVEKEVISRANKHR